MKASAILILIATCASSGFAQARSPMGCGAFADEAAHDAHVWARHELIQLYTRWNGRFPQNAGVPFMEIGLTAVLMRNPLAVDELAKSLTAEEVDRLGQAVNAHHANAPSPVHVRYEPSVIGPSSVTLADGRRVFGPDRLRRLYLSVANGALIYAIAFAQSMAAERRDGADAVADRFWTPILSDMKTLWFQYRMTGVSFLPLCPEIVAYLRSENDPVQREFLRRTGEAIQSALAATAVSPTGFRNRIMQSAGGAGLRNEALSDEFAVRLHERLEHEFVERSAPERGLILQSVLEAMKR